MGAVQTGEQLSKWGGSHRVARVWTGSWGEEVLSSEPAHSGKFRLCHQLRSGVGKREMCKEGGMQQSTPEVCAGLAPALFPLCFH